jgi:solute carrier family 35 (UDP-galactose transporter), member B1
MEQLNGHQNGLQNGHSKSVANGSANGSAASKPEESGTEDSSPGLVQLAICVAGIYASLYDYGL